MCVHVRACTHTHTPAPYFGAHHSLHVDPVRQTFLCAHYLYAQTHTVSEVKISNAAPAGGQFGEQDEAERKRGSEMQPQQNLGHQPY